MGIRISELPELVGVLTAQDLFELVDVSDTFISPSGTSKKGTIAQLIQLLNSRLKSSALLAMADPVTLNVDVVAGETLQEIVLAEGNRVVLTAQNDPAENGLWVVQTSAPPVRPDDFQAGLSVSMALVPVEDGDWAGSLWVCTAKTGADIVDTDVLPFQRLNASNPPFTDAVAVLFRDGHDTAQLRFNLGNISDSQTRVITVPDSNLDLGDLALRNTSGQYSGSHIANNSTVIGASVSDALDTLKSTLVGGGGGGSGKTGLVLSNNGVSPNTKLDVSSGSILLDTGDQVSLGSAMTKRLDQTWVAGTGNGGLDTGAVAADEWYYVWIIYNSGTLTTDVLLSLSSSNPTMPGGYDEKALLGAIHTNGSTHIELFTQWNDWIFWNTPTLDVSFTSNVTTSALYALRVPDSYQTECRLMLTAGGDIQGLVRMSSPGVTDVAVSPGLATIASGDSADSDILTDSLGRIRLRANSVGVVVQIYTLGWRFPG